MVWVHPFLTGGQNRTLSRKQNRVAENRTVTRNAVTPVFVCRSFSLSATSSVGGGVTCFAFMSHALCHPAFDRQICPGR